jgi:hypothetical protein
MNEPLQPTAEAIEAALSAFDADRSTRMLSDDSQVFTRLMSSNPRLQAEIVSAIKFVTDIEVPDELKSEFTEADMLIYKVNALCDMFFWVGWHSRGAVEDADQLKRMAE